MNPKVLSPHWQQKMDHIDLSPQDEKTLFSEGDLEEVLNRQYRLIASIAREFSYTNIPLDDLMQKAVDIYWECLRVHKPNIGKRIGQHAVPKMREGLRQFSHATVGIQSDYKRPPVAETPRQNSSPTTAPSNPSPAATHPPIPAYLVAALNKAGVSESLHRKIFNMNVNLRNNQEEWQIAASNDFRQCVFASGMSSDQLMELVKLGYTEDSPPIDDLEVINGLTIPMLLKKEFDAMPEGSKHDLFEYYAEPLNDKNHRILKGLYIEGHSIEKMSQYMKLDPVKIRDYELRAQEKVLNKVRNDDFLASRVDELYG